MKTKQKTYETVNNYINIVNNEAREIESLESLLAKKHKKIEKTIAKLRAYKMREIVRQASKYNYETNKEQ